MLNFWRHSPKLPLCCKKKISFSCINITCTMYLTDSNIHDRFNPEEYNDFKFWREPIMEISFDDLEVDLVEKKVETSISNQFDSFLYWRDPIPELEEIL
ncbi:WRNPLPNID domain-containing protein [Trichonephila clavata]|uniref:WRNPLPNID domain-containing protein n=1 Tax=Trichonephila clavata TaxID=2740835 RepID=A0A8X6HAK2_TRICU|nr:WRNPLPNID domain-containing protein [Trichonephila clavata]